MSHSRGRVLRGPRELAAFFRCVKWSWRSGALGRSTAHSTRLAGSRGISRDLRTRSIVPIGLDTFRRYARTPRIAHVASTGVRPRLHRHHGLQLVNSVAFCWRNKWSRDGLGMKTIFALERLARGLVASAEAPSRDHRETTEIRVNERRAIEGRGCGRRCARPKRPSGVSFLAFESVS